MQFKRSGFYAITFAALMCLVAADFSMAQPGGGRQRGGPGGGFGGGFGRTASSGADMASLLQSEDVKDELDLTDVQVISIDAAIAAYNDERREERRPGGGFDFRAFQAASEEEQAKMREDMQKQREEDQKKREELSKKTDEVVVAFLEADQVERLNQLRVQSMGAEALRNTELQKALKISESQTEQIDNAFATMGEKRTALFSSMRGAGRGGDQRQGADGGGRPQRPGAEGGGRPQRPGGEEGGRAGRRPGGEGGAGGGFEEVRAKMDELNKEFEESAMKVLTAEQTEQLAKMKGEKFEGELRAQRRGGFGGGRTGGRPGGDR